MQETHQINREFEWGRLDRVEELSAGVIRVVGWSRRSIKNIPAPRVLVNSLPLLECLPFRAPRPDVHNRLRLSVMSGIAWEYPLTPNDGLKPGTSASFEVYSGDELLCGPLPLSWQEVDFGHLLVADRVQHRPDIYSSAPTPPRVISEHVFDLVCEVVREPVLDFGCGAGMLTHALRRRGIETTGMDLDIPWITEHLLDEVRPHVKLYEGEFPLPFEENSFGTVVASEVLEHIADYEVAVRELHRVCGRNVLITVPNLNAIPILAEHYVVPWHLLEADHCNFFTQKSLGRLLEPLFNDVEFAQLHSRYTNDTCWYANLVAICTK